MFGLNLKKLRMTNGITQTQLARDLDVSNGTVGNWESGAREPDLDMVKRIADYFHSTTDFLLGKETEENNDAKVALFGGDVTVTDEMWEEVKQFAEYVKSKNNNKR